jgi:FK506-binding protein 2
MVIKGWDQGLLGACVGEKRKLRIPASLGYGDRGAPPTIPPGAKLIFTTEIVDIVAK